MINKNYLTKKYLYNTYHNWDKDTVFANKRNYIDFLNKIEKEFYTHDFKEDDRYVCVGFHKGRIKELHELYYPAGKVKELISPLKDFVCPTKRGMWDFIDLLTLPSNPVSLKESEGIYSNKNNEECKSIFNSYIQDGIVSLNERDVILHALNMLRDSLDKCDDNLEWDYD